MTARVEAGAPLVYAVPVYVVVWLTGLGGFFDTAFLEETAKDYGLSALPSWFQLSTYIFLAMTVGFIPNIGPALGEEIGWRGFLVPELSKVPGITGIGLISGLMWAAVSACRVNELGVTRWTLITPPCLDL